MRSGVIAQKVGMTRIFTEAGEHVPVTVLRLGNCQVVAHRTQEKNGYVALQLGAGVRKVKNVVKAERGLIMVRGAIPGAKGGYVLVRDAVKRKSPDGVPFPAGLKAAEGAAASSGDKPAGTEKE